MVPIKDPTAVLADAVARDATAADDALSWLGSHVDDTQVVRDAFVAGRGRAHRNSITEKELFAARYAIHTVQRQ
jgi:hypothetical protein